jgi:hypothetical protein
MKRLLQVIVVTVLASWLFARGATSQEAPPPFTPSGHVWGYVFGDAYYKAAGDTLQWGRSQYAATPTQMMGGQLRRLYLGYDYRFSPTVSSRILLEADDTFQINNAHGLYIKQGYVEMKGWIPNAAVQVGLIPTPVFSVPERHWGYRSIEKESLNLRGFGRSVDQGVSLTGTIDGAGLYGYSFMVGTGSGNRIDRDRFLEYYGSLHTRLFERRLLLEAMGNYKYNGDDRSRTIVRGFAGYEANGVSLGASVAQALDRAVPLAAGPTDLRGLVISGFGSATLPFISTDLRLFARYDYFDPDIDYVAQRSYADPAHFYRENNIMAGLHYKAAGNVNIMPNVWINTYSDKRNGDQLDRKADVVLRTTLYFVFR